MEAHNSAEKYKHHFISRRQQRSGKGENLNADTTQQSNTRTSTRSQTLLSNAHVPRGPHDQGYVIHASIPYSFYPIQTCNVGLQSAPVGIFRMPYLNEYKQRCFFFRYEF